MKASHRCRRAGYLAAGLMFLGTAQALAASLDQLTELTGKVTPIVTLKGRDNFNSEYRYDISVRNLSPDPIVGDSLIIVLDKITNLAGEEREPLRSETILSQFDVLGQDGETDEGKPFFKIPPGSTADLLPQIDSRPATMRLRNRDYLAIFTPVFRVYGQRRLPPEPKRTDVVPTPPTPPSSGRTTADKLLQLLLKKGVITEEEWRRANQP